MTCHHPQPAHSCNCKAPPRTSSSRYATFVCGVLYATNLVTWCFCWPWLLIQIGSACDSLRELLECQGGFEMRPTFASHTDDAGPGSKPDISGCRMHPVTPPHRPWRTCWSGHAAELTVARPPISHHRPCLARGCTQGERDYWHWRNGEQTHDSSHARVAVGPPRVGSLAR